MKKLFQIILMTFLIPIAASATDWLLHCTSGNKRTAVYPSEHVCFDPTANTDDSPILSVGQCERTNWALFDDKDGDTTVCTVDFTLETCPATGLGATAADNACAQVDGTTTLSGDSQEAAIGAGPYLRVEASDSGSNAGDCRVIVHCLGPWS